MQVVSVGPIFVDRSETFVALMSEICLFFGCGQHFVESRPPVLARTSSKRFGILEKYQVTGAQAPIVFSFPYPSVFSFPLPQPLSSFVSLFRLHLVFLLCPVLILQGSSFLITSFSISTA